MIAVLGGLADVERDLIRTRTAEGRSERRSAGSTWAGRRNVLRPVASYLAAVLFTVGKHLISLYIGSSNIASIYGAAGALIIILVLVYYSVQILLFGAELAKAYTDQRRARFRELRKQLEPTI
jgi:hypothetical protein